MKKTYEDWLKEYYPETASEAATKSRENNDSGLYAAKHSLKKWEGACKKRLMSTTCTWIPLNYAVMLVILQ